MMNYYGKFMIIMFFFFNYWTRAVVGESPLLMLSEDEMVEIAGYGQQKLSTVLVTGTLLCGHHPNIPVSGASVAVSCHPGRKTRQSNWVKSTTDEYGDFLIDLPSHLHGIPNLEKICFVRVVQLPNNSPCNSAFTGKYKRITLSSIDEGIRTYTTQPIHIYKTT